MLPLTGAPFIIKGGHNGGKIKVRHNKISVVTQGGSASIRPASYFSETGHPGDLYSGTWERRQGAGCPKGIAAEHNDIGLGFL